MDHKPLISIITPVYNAASTLGDTLQSIAMQKFGAYELLVLDGGSTDGSVDIIKQYEPLITYWRSHKDNGFAYAMNEGVQKATGTYIYILNADDFLADESVLSDVAFFMERYGYPAYVNGDVKMIYFNPYYVYRRRGALSKKAMLMNKQPPHPGAFIKRTVFEQMGYFNTSLSISVDFDFFCRLAHFGFHDAKMDRVIAYYRSGGISYNKMKGFQENAWSIKKYFGKGAFVFYLIKYKLFLFVRKSSRLLGVFHWYHKLKKQITSRQDQ